MGLGKTLGGHGRLFLDHITQALSDHAGRAGGQAARVLVSGSADYSMLAHVLHAAREAAVPVVVTVLDQCETPLRLSRWYAERSGFAELTLACADVLAYRPEAPFDLIVTSSFFGYFGPAQRVALFGSYAQMLAPAGRLVFSNRLRPGPEDQTVGFTDAQALAFESRVLALGAHLPEALGLPEADWRALARRYVQLFHAHPLNGPQTVIDLAHASGLDVLRLDGLHNEAAQPGVSGPTTSDASPYVFAVLQRPAG
jgi:SAM-dependent methyltransferase